MKMLADLERQFFNHVRSGGQQRLRAGACADGIVAATLGLSIYTNAYRARLREALESDHPILALYLGDELWAQMCDGYIDAHPSRHRSLRQFGESVPIFLGAHAPFATHPLIAELASFERLLLDVFDAGDAPREEWSALLVLAPDAWPNMRLRVHPSVRVVATTTNAVAVWQALKAEADPPAADSAPAPALLMWRDRERISRFRTLPADEHAAILVVNNAGNFASMCESMVPFHPSADIPVRAIGILQNWFAEGIVTAVETNEPADT